MAHSPSNPSAALAASFERGRKHRAGDQIVGALGRDRHRAGVWTDSTAIRKTQTARAVSRRDRDGITRRWNAVGENARDTSPAIVERREGWCTLWRPERRLRKKKGARRAPTAFHDLALAGPESDRSQITRAAGPWPTRTDNRAQNLARHSAQNRRRRSGIRRYRVSSLQQDLRESCRR